jgi:hypothetical protein
VRFPLFSALRLCPLDHRKQDFLVRFPLAKGALRPYIHGMAHAITMRELQKLSASTIEQLPGAVPVQSDGRTVALLVPLRPASQEARARFREALAKAQAERTAEEQEALDREFGA